MPTLRNLGTHVHIIERIDGAQVPVGPGETIQTYSPQAGALTGMSQVSPAPYYNPAIEAAYVVSGGPGDDQVISIDPEAGSVEIINSSHAATITVYLTSPANAPGLKVPPQSTRTIDSIRGRASSLVLRFDAAIQDGECYVTQLR